MNGDTAELIRVNLPMVILNVLSNLFFVFCLMRPSQGETLKQPLKLLLWTMVCSTLSFLVTLLVLFHFVSDSIVTSLTSYGMFVVSLSISMNTSVWLNFFYYMQIVPSKSAVFVWIKRNLKPIIYYIWVAEKLYIGLFVSSIVLFNITVIKYELEYLNIVNTSSVASFETASHLRTLTTTIVLSGEIYFISNLCIMLASSWCTVVYLSRHMHQMASQGLSGSRFRSQVRVTATGILQGALYLVISVWTLSQFQFSDIIADYTACVSLSNITMINVYMMGTSVNLGVGQTVFRQRAVDLWHRAVRSCTTIKAQPK